MKINKSMEQGVLVIIILALQKGHTPLKSQQLSKILEVSDSYLKKILRKLVVAKLIKSSASKDGGFTLLKSFETITLFDVYNVLDGDMNIGDFSLSERIFEDKAHTKEGMGKLKKVFETAQQKFYEELKGFRLVELVKKDVYENGVIEWEKL